MLNGKRVLAIIPARVGSKRLPNKNIMDLCGKPLIAYTIEAALKSDFIDKVIVSTDCDEISEISKKYGADVPFIRPGHLGADTSTTMDVVMHAVDKVKQIHDDFDFIVLLQPTSPLRNFCNINQAVELMSTLEVNSIVSVCECEHSPLWSNTLPKNNSMKGFLNESITNKRSQDLPTFYRLNGAIYISEIEHLKKYGSFLTKDTFAYLMDRDRSVDIDDIRDFQLAEIIMSDTKHYT
ncbi:MAG: CMP-N,N'-diacetyllegionaminic acid synthase [Mariniflexile sp.]|jgi:CMP-N,N'-diacetyllegionaminic acid synthase